MSSLSRPLTYLQNVNVDNVLAEKRIGEAIFATDSVQKMIKQLSVVMTVSPIVLKQDHAVSHG